jgi:hypothetical protein
MLNVKEFGAKGDGTTDDTGALQAALDRAAETQGTVFVPEGVYLTGELKLSSHTGIQGIATPAFQGMGGTILKLNDDKARGMLNLTGALGVTVNGICMDGAKLPGETHGIFFDKPDFGKEEDTPRIERCRIDNFSGDGIHLGRIWCFSIRHCHLFRNAGWGVWVRGWDGFVLDNWITCSGKAGFGGEGANSAITFTGNRIEWNKLGGVVSYGGRNWNVTGNYFDRSGGNAIALLPRDGEHPCHGWAITGNILHRSGSPDFRPLEDYENAHARFVGAKGVSFVGNAMKAGQGDRNQGTWSPDFGIVFKDLENCVIKDNVMHEGVMKDLVVDLGGHGQDVIVRDNVGSLKRAD